MTVGGGTAFDAQLVHFLSQRLQVEDWYGRHPEIEDQAIVAPLIGLGLPRTGSTALGCLLGEDPAVRSLRSWEASQAIQNNAHLLSQLCRETDSRAHKQAALKIAQQMPDAGNLVPGFTAQLKQIDENISGFATLYADNLQRLQGAALSTTEPRS